jgi:hypothetical protein
MDGDQSQWGVMHHTEQDHGHLVQPAVVPGRVCIGCVHGLVAGHLRPVHSKGLAGSDHAPRVHAPAGHELCGQALANLAVVGGDGAPAPGKPYNGGVVHLHLHNVKVVGAGEDKFVQLPAAVPGRA